MTDEMPEAQRLCDFAWLRATNGGETQGYPPIIRRLLAAYDEQEQRLAGATTLLTRIVKYAREDRASTPGSTRLARVLEESERFLFATSSPTAEPGSSIDLGEALRESLRRGAREAGGR
jgi:hypothetical protein